MGERLTVSGIGRVLPTTPCGRVRRLTERTVERLKPHAGLSSAFSRVVVSLFTSLCLAGSVAEGQLVDSLDAYPPRWQLASSDCEAIVTGHGNDPSGGLGGTGCERLTLRCGHGTEALLEYRIEPTRVIDELNATVYLKSAHTGQSIGFRVRFPFLTDPASGRPLSVVIVGANYREAGSWQRIGIGAIAQALRVKTYALRREYGGDADLSNPFVDAIVINAYVGPGESTLRLDQLVVDSMVAVTSMKSLAAEGGRDAVTRPQRFDTAKFGTAKYDAGRLDTGPIDSGPIDAATSPRPSRRTTTRSPFPGGTITRILQHNGEPLDWIRSLGFDAVLLSQPPDQAILNAASRAGIKLYAPPPSEPDRRSDALLDPLAGYYLGTSLPASRLATTAAEADRISRWPEAWRRPVLVAPAEAVRDFAVFSDAVVHDIPPTVRGLSPDEEVAAIAARVDRSGPTATGVIGIQTEVPVSLRRQLDSISAAIGAPRGNDLFWHALWLQVARSLESTPRAILFRSESSLTSGTARAQQRSLALSYINRYLESIGGLVAEGVGGSPLTTSGPPFRGGRIDFPGGQLLVLTTQAGHRGLTLAGDGGTLRVTLPPGDAGKTAWRLTHFTAERVGISTTSQGVSLELISPDVVETIVLSSDTSMGGRLAGSLKKLATRAATDRWQLGDEATTQVSEDWQAATVSRIAADSSTARGLLGAARGSLRDAEPALRGGDPGAALRMTRRSDAWMLKARWQLQSALSPDGKLDSAISCPPLLTAGGLPAQILWWPLMSDAGWGDNLLVAGSLDSPELLGDAGWIVGKRPDSAWVATTDTRIVTTSAGGHLLASVVTPTGQPLPGGYEGTALQIRSPSIRCGEKLPLRIDAKVRTLGFGGPDQGVLVYDSIGGPELGVLVKNASQWQSIRLYRQTPAEAELTVIFELIGAGEVAIDEVTVRTWSARAAEPIPMRQLDRDQVSR